MTSIPNITVKMIWNIQHLEEIFSKTWEVSEETTKQFTNLQVFMVNPNDYTSISDMLKDCNWEEDQTDDCFTRGSDKIPFTDIVGHTTQSFAKSIKEEWLTPLPPEFTPPDIPNIDIDYSGYAGVLGTLGYI